ncbi:MAG: PAS domain S-box protein, partial [Acidobacteria bacterium]|nr:PAS domain S-box protein [Acidobacteriota bacterium]
AREASEKLFATIFQASPLPICLSDTESGRQLEVNPAWSELFGYSTEEAVGRTGLELGLWERPLDRMDFLTQLRRDGSVRSFDMLARTRAGEVRHLLNAAETLQLNGKSHFLTVHQDITGRKSAEERFVKAFDANPNPMLILALPAQQITQITQMNAAWQSFSGYNAVEWEEMTQRGESFWADEEQRQKFFELVRLHGKARDFEAQLLIREQQVRTVLLGAEPIELEGQPHLIVSASDITERKQAEEALKVSEERFGKAFNACPDPMAITTVAEGRYVMVNDAWQRAHGLQADEVLGRTSQELELWVDAEERRRFYELIVSQGSVRDFETRVRNASGGVDDVLTSSDMVMLGGEWYVLSVTRNITERKRAEEALKVSEHRFATTFNACPEPMMLSRMSDGRFVTMNAVALRALGLSEKEVVGRTAEELSLWVDEQQRQSLEQQLLAQGEVRDFECRFTLKGGRLGDFLVSAEIIDLDGAPHVLLVSRDITERKRAEAALRATEEQLARTFEACPEPMLLTRADDSVIVALNEAAVKTFGYARAEAVGKTIREFAFWSSKEQLQQFNQLLRAPGVVKDFEADLLITGQRLAHFLLSAETMHLDGVPHVLCIGRDITERKRAEAALRESEERFSKVFTASPHPMTLTSFPDGKLLMVNEAWTRLHGYSVVEALSHDSAELSLWVSAEHRSAFYQQVAEHGSVRNFECVMHDKDGGAHELLLSAERVELGQQDYMISIVLDLTERRLAEAALRASEERFEQAFRLSPCPLVINSLDGRIVYVNEAVTKVTGFMFDELKGKTAFEAGLWDSPEQRAAILREFKATGSVRNREAVFRTTDGRRLQALYSSERVEFNGAPHVLSSLVDITEIKRIEGALRASQERFATAFLASPQAMMISHTATGQVVSANPCLLQLVGCAENEIVGRTMKELGWWEPEDFQQELTTRFQKESVIRAWRTTLRGANGAPRKVELAVDPIQLDDTAHLLFNLTDVTERERAEAALRASEERFSKAFHASPQALLIARTDNGQIVSTNRSFCL